MHHQLHRRNNHAYIECQQLACDGSLSSQRLMWTMCIHSPRDTPSSQPETPWRSGLHLHCSLAGAHEPLNYVSSAHPQASIKKMNNFILLSTTSLSCFTCYKMLKVNSVIWFGMHPTVWINFTTFRPCSDTIIWTAWCGSGTMAMEVWDVKSRSALKLTVVEAQAVEWIVGTIDRLDRFFMILAANHCQSA